MSWKVRHQGSPQSRDDVTLAQVVEGLRDGVWEPTDEVMGPEETQWVAIENHPQLAEIAEEIEPPPMGAHDDETRLDMNALIDVCLVLLIFFILTTSYAEVIAKVVPMNPGAPKQDGPVTVVSQQQADKYMILTEAHLKVDKVIVKIEGKEVATWDDKEPSPDTRELQRVIKDRVRATQKRELLLDARGISWGSMVAIQDAARGGGVTMIHNVSKK